jgi:hypothetical protein
MNPRPDLKKWFQYRGETYQLRFHASKATSYYLVKYVSKIESWTTCPLNDEWVPDNIRELYRICDMWVQSGFDMPLSAFIYKLGFADA